MAIGGSGNVAHSSRNTLVRKRLHKQLAARRMLLEALEGRQLMAVGPQLLGIQPNEGSLLVDGQVRHTAPNELVFRFDDRVGLDPNSLDGIRLIRSGGDGAFERASMATDLGSNGQSLVEFYAAEPGEVGNGIAIEFTRASRGDTRLPAVQVNGRTIQVQLNSNPLLETRVEDLLRVFDQNTPSAVTNLVYALRLRGSTTLPIGRTVNTAAPVILSGANSARVTTDFGTGANTQVRLIAKDSGPQGIGLTVNVTARDMGGPGAPNVTVNGKVISIELNSNTRFASTVNDFVAALNGNAASSALVEATLISGVGATRLGTLPVNYSPLVLGGVSDVEIVPAFIGLGDTSREVIMRFGETLPDDQYRVEILGRGTRALLNANGQPFNDGIDKAIDFELDLGAHIESIVPQPVERNAQGKLVQASNRIDVYFNDDDLIDLGKIRTVNGLTIDQLRTQRPVLFLQNSDVLVNHQGAVFTADVLGAQFYQLYHLNGTLSNVDDTRVLPTAVRYYPDADRVTLTFSRALDELVDPATNATLTRSELRLRIGTNEAKPLPPVAYTPVGDARDTFAAADSLEPLWKPGLTGSQSVIINSEVRNTTPFVLDFPGGSDEIGNRYNRMQDHLRRNANGTLVSADAEDGTAVVFYNFQTQLGRFTGTTLLNSITEQQKQRTREVLSLYERYLGVRFVETENLGFTIAVSDTRAVSPFPETSGIASSGVVTLNSLGAEYLESGFLATGQLATVLDSQDFGNSTGNEFAGPFSRAVMQGIGNLLGLGNTDDLPGFSTQSFNAVLAPGIGTEIVLPGDAEIVHGQYLYRPDSKDIDLYQFRLPVSGRLSIEAFAERMSQASLLDSQIRLYQQQANGSWIEVAANDDYFSSDSFVELDLSAGNYIVGISASGNNQYDPSISDSGLGGRSQGAYQLRMDFRPPAGAVLRDATGTSIDGDADGQAGGVFDFWFRPSGASNTKYVDKSVLTSGNGTINSPFKFIKDALAAAVPGDVVRIVGNGGADGKINTPADNLAYEIGFDALGRPLTDGTTLDVPKDVSVFIDAGAILKLRRSRVGVGSTSASVDRSGGSLLVLGTPVLVDANGAVLKDPSGVASSGDVYFTSLSDTTLGKGISPPINNATPLPGDWGGIDFRNRIDGQDETRKNYERLGQFLNSVSHADVRYGGGQVVVDGVSQVVTPIQMVDARPAVFFSEITLSADAAMSATPNSFLESNFHTPDEQRSGLFSIDYDRVGPDIHGNRLTGNSINGLQVRARTSGGSLESMTVAGRFDDTDIVHVVTENLQVAGTPGGFISDVNAPPTTIVTLTVQSGGTLPVGKFNYRLTYVDSSGNESPASTPTQTVDVLTAGSSIVLQNLPPVRTGSSFVARRLYRSDATGTGNYVLVRELNASSTTIVDTGVSLGAPLNEAPITLRSRLDGRLAIDPGLVVKLQGSRIDVQAGAQLIAEGTPDRPVVFTSTSDERYGAGGTFETSSSGNPASAGNWGGIYVGPTSSASLDYAVIAYGGGTTRIEGGFADFNAIETHQGDLRLTHSRLEVNAGGTGTATVSDRSGRGTNDNAVIFVRGAQPVIVENTIINNRGAGISANVSALNSQIVTDWGRSTGALERASERLDNQGPLIVGNRFDANAMNGLHVRAGVLTTEGVWDDTDVVHIVTGRIEASDFHAYGGLRLQSSATQSLVVKLLSKEGTVAGLAATGSELDNADHIGGSVQLVGTPGNPVLMTSLYDCTVGVGFTPDGRPQRDTLSLGACETRVDVVPFADIVVVMDDSASMGFAQQFSAQLMQDIDSALRAAGIGATAAGANQFGLLAYGGATTDTAPLAVPLGPNGTLFASAVDYAAGVQTLQANGAIEDGYLAIDYALDTYQFRQQAEKFVLLVTNEDRDIVDGSKTYDSVMAKLRARDVHFDGIVSADFRDARNAIALAVDSDRNAYTADGGGGYIVSTNGTVRNAFFDTTVEDYVDMIFEIGGLAGDIDQIQFGGTTAQSFGSVFVDSIVKQAGGTVNLPEPGDWNSVLIGRHSNDRNVAAVTEIESPQSQSSGSNGSPVSGEFLGDLAPNLNTSDETRRLGYQVQGVIANPSDVDVYSFRGTAGTEVWLDIDRTLNSLDTVVELVDSNGRILALSDNSLAEEANPSLLFAATDMPSQSVHSLRKSTPELYLTSATGAPKDLYSTNPRDAGMRVVLPGEPGSSVLYHVRVRSSNLREGDPASRLLDPAFLNAGITRGAYQLQLRLREIDEVPGSGVTYADLRYATNGIEIVGMPGHSPLLGETAETTGPNESIGTAQPVGNILTTDRQALSIAGTLNGFTDVDWYSFNIDYTAIRPTGLREYFATVFDVDYGDGIGRPDTSIYVFDEQGRLILSGLGSNLVDDQAGGLAGAGNTDQSRGSAGSLDPFIGAAELPVGRYFLAVTNSSRVPGVMESYTSATPSGATAGVRLQPINGVQLIAEDHIGSRGGSTAVAPQTPVLFPQNNSAVEFNLGDVTLYVSQNINPNTTNLYMVNPFTGEVSNTVGRFGLNVQDIAFRYNGGLRAFDWSPQFPNSGTDQDTLMDYIDINPGTAAATDIGDLNLSTHHIDGTAAADSNDGIYPNAITFASIGGQERGFIVGSRGTRFPRANVGTARPGVDYLENVIYEFDENNGNATSSPAGDKTGIATGLDAGTAVRERGYIETSRQGAAITGLIGREATRALPDGTAVALINDGDSFTLLDSANFTAVFEFDSGPEVLVNFDPAAGLTIADGSQFKLDGNLYEFDTLQGTPGVTPGAIAIPINAQGSFRQLVDAIARHVQNGITVTADGNRMTFSGATVGDFTQLQNQGVFIDQGSSGNVRPGAIKVPFLPTDSANDLAARMVIAINSSGIPGLSASANAAQVNINGGTVADPGVLNVAGAPGGTITGAAVINNVMYAVSDAGGLFRVNSPTSLSTGNVGTYVSTSYELLGIRFSGLSAGPAHMQNGAFAQTLFGIDEDGIMYAFDTAGRLLPIFAGGATSVDTGLFNVNGLSFSTLDYNLWHVSNNRGTEPGHGLPVTPDASRGVAVNGGSSLYFGFESPGANGVPLTGVTDPGIRNSYDFPGGAAGAIESQPFDLSGLSSGDLPTLYFNYRFDSEEANAALPLGQSQTDYMRDALRVYVSGEDGQWILAATNNSTRGPNSGDDEFDPLLTGNADVQELFDNNGQWRQARVPLDAFAGQGNVKLRIEFSSAGGFGFGLRGGRGPELRMLPGNRLADGQTVNIGGRTFEIEMGPSLSLPAGRAINNGDSVTIEGVNYVFTDGSGPPVASPDVAVPFTSTQSAEQVAATLLGLIRSTLRPQTVINVNATERNDTLTTATIGFESGDSAIVTVTGNIGDNTSLPDPTSDVDMVRVELARGTTVLAQVNALSLGSALDSYLRVFDSQGRQLAANDNSVGTTDSRIIFVAPEDGTYYFGVSGAGNSAYNASVFGTGTGASSGSYQLVLDVFRQLNAVQVGERIQLEGAAHVSVASGTSVLLQGSLGTTGEPVYVNAGMTANQVGQALQQALARVYADGRTTAFSLRGDTLDLTGLVQYDSFDFFTGLRAPSLQQLDPGPFGATTNFVGDAFGAFNASTDFAGNRNNANPGALRAQNNAFEGVYLDDFIIGVAGRGEMVLNAPVDTNFIRDPQLDATLPVKTNPEILVGPYQVEIRGGSEYGTPLLDGFPRTLALHRAVAPQERLSEGVSLVFNGASSLVAGSTFTISDGTRQLTFELDNLEDSVGTQPGNVPVAFSNAAFDPVTGTLRSESAQTIAARVRDIINSAAVQSVLDINAILINSDAVGESSATVVLIGQANVNMPASIGRTIISKGDGDSNRQREQGQIVVRSAKVTNSRAFGVRIDAGGRDELGVSQGGSPRNLLTLNTDRLSTGAVVMNSELVGNLAGGISVAGEPVTSGVSAAVPYARLVNNTIVGTVDRSLFRDRQYADSVITYLPGLAGLSPEKGLDDPAAALNEPDYTGSGEPTGVQGAVSLGQGGQLTLEFTNNSIVGNGNGNPDLSITEVGTPERYLVEASIDGVQYVTLGFGVGSADFNVDFLFPGQQPPQVRYIRITDAGSNVGTLAAAGADIDAVVATSSIDTEAGIRVINNASPTILNSVITNSPVGLRVDASSSSSVVGGMAYHRNTANIAGSATLGQFPQLVDPTREVFLDLENGNLYPAPGSPIIDSSMDSLQDRPSLVTVKNSIGMGASPILAPQYDINGSLRVDDPNVASPAGLGENVFKDRGAQDRADTVGPSAVVLTPADNDVAGQDGNPATSVVELTNFTARFFDIQLFDGLEPSDPNRGSNINDATVTSSSVLVYQDNLPLVEGIDYRFGYDATTNVIRLTPLAGVFSSSSVYQIRFVNTREFAITTQLTSDNNADGSTIDIVDTSNTRTTFELDTGYRVSVPTSDGFTADVSDGGVFTIDDGARRLTFEFDTDGQVSGSNLAVPLSSSPTVVEVAQLIQSAVELTGLQLNVVNLGFGNLQIDGSVTSAFIAGTSGLQVTGRPGVRPALGLQIPLSAGRPVTLVDGESFTIRRTSLPVTFELDTNGVVTPGRIPVRFAAGASASTIGQALVTAIRNAGLGLLPTYAGNGLITLGGDANTVLGLSNTQLLQAGTAGLPAARPIKLSLQGGATSAEIANQIANAINSAKLPGVTATPFGDRVVISGASDVSGSQVNLIQGITDNAGNALKANQVDGSSTLTIFLGEGMDYGDAPDPTYTTKRDNNGPRHTVVPGFSLGADVRPDADAKTPDGDEFDDGVTFTQSLVAAFQSSVRVEVNRPQGTNAYLSGWIDYNGDGVFSASERIVNALPVTQQFTTLSFIVSGASTVGTTYARFRLSSDPTSVATPTGTAPDGEVEDHQVTIVANPFQNQANRMDVNRDGHVSPIDVLQVINYINDPTKPKTLTLPPTISVPPFVDVNGDGSVSGIDALLVINFLNSLPPGGGEGEGAVDGSNVATVHSGDWLQSMVSSAAPTVAGRAAAEAGTKVQPRDAYFATMNEEDDLPVDFDASNDRASVYDSVLDSIDGSTAEVDDEIAADQAGWTIRQRLAGFFRS